MPLLLQSVQKSPAVSSTRPSGSTVDEWRLRAVFSVPTPFQVPAEVTILEAPDGSGVSFDGPLIENERWPMLSISHYASDFYRPGKGVEVRDWILDSEITYDEIGLEAELAGLPVIHLSVEPTPQSYGFDQYFLIKDHQLFRIELLHTRGEEDWDLYHQFLDSFTFLE